MSFVVSLLLCLSILVSIFSNVESRSMKVTCIGDSITSGGGCVAESYTDILATNLGPGFSVMNAGVSGRTMLRKGVLDSTLRPFSYWDTDTWTNALNSDADIVTIMLGTNDAKYYNWENVQQNTGDYYVLDYIDMINQLRQQLRPETEFFLMIPPPVFQPYPFDMNGTIINKVFPTLIPNIATVVNRYQVAPLKNQNIHIIDLHTPLLGNPTYTCDNCHPTHDANVIFADIIAKKIQSVLNEKAHTPYRKHHSQSQKDEKQKVLRSVSKASSQHWWSSMFSGWIIDPVQKFFA